MTYEFTVTDLQEGLDSEPAPQVPVAAKTGRLGFVGHLTRAWREEAKAALYGEFMAGEEQPSYRDEAYNAARTLLAMKTALVSPNSKTAILRRLRRWLVDAATPPKTRRAIAALIINLSYGRKLEDPANG